MELDFSGIDQRTLRSKIEEIRSKVKTHPTIIDVFRKYEIPIDEIDLIPMAFAKMPVSARTEHGCIYFSTKLLEDGFDNDDHYAVHEISHFAQQSTGNSPTQSSDVGSYLDNEAEVEAFQHQVEYMADERGEEEAEEYVNDVLDHHDITGKERSKRFNELTSLAMIKTSALNEKWAREIIVTAFKDVMGREPTQAEAQGAQAVARLESSYGQGWRAAGAGSNNWGAVQTRDNSAPGFQYQDSYTNNRGEVVKYNVRFKSYPTPVEGAKDVIKHLFKSNRKQQKLTPQNRAGGGDIPGPGRAELLVQAATNGDVYQWSKAMWWTTYYEGFGAQVQKKIDNHVKAMNSSLASIAAGNEETALLTDRGAKYLPETTDAAYLAELQTKMGLAEQAQPIQAQPVAENDNSIDQEVQRAMNFLSAARYRELSKIARGI